MQENPRRRQKNAKVGLYVSGRSPETPNKFKKRILKKNGERLKHGEFYRELFQESDEFIIEIHKVKGHQKDRITIEGKIFAYIDHSCRKRLRNMLLNKK